MPNSTNEGHATFVNKSTVLPVYAISKATTFHGAWGPPNASCLVKIYEHDPSKPAGQRDTEIDSFNPTGQIIGSGRIFTFSKPANTFKAGKVYRIKIWCSLGLIDVPPTEWGFNVPNNQ